MRTSLAVSCGETRTIVLAGGGSMSETLTSVDEPKSFGHIITEVTGPMAPLIDRVDGAWIFAAGAGIAVGLPGGLSAVMSS